MRPSSARLRIAGVLFGAVASCSTIAATAIEESSPSTTADACGALEARISRLRPDLRAAVADEDRAAWWRRMVREVEVEAALAAEAVEAGLAGEPEWRRRMAAGRATLLLGALDASFAADVTVAAEEIERSYETDRDRFRAPAKISTSFILLELEPDAAAEEVEDAKRRLLEIRARHLAGERFGALAREHSDAENAARGGAVAASPRGRLLAAYEEVAWNLAAGEVSDPFRLPDGVAIVKLEHLFPARELSLEEARAGIERGLVEEKVRRRREAALAEARDLWPSTVAWPDGRMGPPAIRFDGEELGLDDLGLAHRPPRLQARVEAALDRRRLVRLAERRELHRTAAAHLIAAFRESTLAAAALERRLEERVPEPGEEELRALYERDASRFPDPERRVFEVAFLPGEEGSLRPVRDAAEALAVSWREGSPPADLERWGPIARDGIGGSTSPLLARIAFSLAAGEVSEPVRLEHYRKQTARFETEGYVVLRLVDIEPASVLPFEAVRERLAREATSEERRAAEAAIRAEIAESLDLESSLRRHASCLPPEAEGNGTASPEDGSTR